MADLIMVGADLSGLCAARALIQQGKFLEARHRVGGRMVRKPVISGG
ncbi:FAD-dependent oxidoreductase [Mycobacterium leprae]|nr:FAD-dependent oxidoreductase [Mycobacterium leprae]